MRALLLGDKSVDRWIKDKFCDIRSFVLYKFIVYRVFWDPILPCYNFTRNTFYMKQADKKGQKNRVGSFGEDISAKYLKRLGHTVLDTNYLKKWGEIDIVSRETLENKHIIHFVEVKTVSYETKHDLEKAVSYGTWRPEENVHPAKIQKLHRAIESWLMEHHADSDWQIDVLAVRLVISEKYSTIKYLPNIIIG